MLLAIDVGNTNIVFGFVQKGTLTHSFRLTTSDKKTSDEFGLALCEYLYCSNLSASSIDDVIISSVVPGVMFALESSIQKYIGKHPIVVDRDVIPKLIYPGRERLGSDRSVACIAAMEKYGTPLIVLDFGTATTMDSVGHNGQYFGGCIFAGMRTCTDALFQNAAMLPRIDLVHPKSVLGMTTVHQIQAGTVMGCIGSIEYLVQKAQEEMPTDDRITVVATGGLAPVIAANTDIIDAVDSDLILSGLCLLYNQYKTEQLQYTTEINFQNHA